MNIKETAQEVFKNATEKGFWQQPREFGTMLMLITSELGEALDADREGKHADLAKFEHRINELNNSIHTEDPSEREKLEMEHFISTFKTIVKDSRGDEMADALIRILDTCEGLGIDIQRHVELKMMYNKTRPKLHGKAY